MTYFKAKGSVISAGSQFTDTVDFNGSYYIVAPIGKSGMAFLGDPRKFASTGKKRIESLSDDGKLHVTVRFAANEKAVTVHLYSPEKPYAMAGSGGVSRVLREGAGLYRVTVTPDQTGSAALIFGTR